MAGHRLRVRLECVRIVMKVGEAHAVDDVVVSIRLSCSSGAVVFRMGMALSIRHGRGHEIGKGAPKTVALPVRSDYTNLLIIILTCAGLHVILSA